MEPLEFTDEGKVKPSLRFVHDLYLSITKKATLISLELYRHKECTWV